jgi:hypothetical protein
MAMIPAMSAADFGTGGTAVMNYGMQVGKDLAAYGEKIGLQMKDNRDKQFATSAIPALQEAMKSFSAGQSGAGYSSIINLAAQDPSNPYVQNLAKLGMMGGQAIDDNKYKMAVANAKTSTGLDQMLPILMLTNPELAEKLSSSLLNNNEPSPTGESSDEVNPALGDANRPDSAQPNPDLPQSETVVKTIEAVNQKKKEFDEGKTFGELIINSEDMVFTPEKLQPFKPNFVKIKGLDKYFPGVEGIAVLPSQQLQNKTINISSRSGLSASFANDPNYQQDSKSFKENITKYLALLDLNKPLQEAIKTLGGIDKLSVESADGGKYKIGNLPKGSKPIKIDKETKEAIAGLSAMPQAAKNANSPFFGEGIDIPAVGQDRKAAAAKFLSE